MHNILRKVKVNEITMQINIHVTKREEYLEI